MAQTNPSDKLTVKVFSPFETYYEGQAVSVSANNDTGLFDVLLDHINFFSVLSTGDVTVDTGTEKKSYPLEKGVMRVTNNVVTVFMNVGS